jgi:hypothetical protein
MFQWIRKTPFVWLLAHIVSNNIVIIIIIGL